MTTTNTAKTKSRLEKNGEVGNKGIKERGSGGESKLYVVNGTPFGIFKKRLAMSCQLVPALTLMACIYVESDGAPMYIHAMWLTGTVGLVGFLNLLFAKME